MQSEKKPQAEERQIMKPDLTQEAILAQLDRIEKAALLGSKNLLTVEDLSQLYGMKKSYLYKLTASREIPFYRRAKALYFKRCEVEAWLTTYRSESNTELEQRAINYQVRKENGL